jgi:hypothetical protein
MKSLCRDTYLCRDEPNLGSLIPNTTFEKPYVTFLSHSCAQAEIKNPLRQGQEEDLGVFGLVLNIITHWNAVYIQEVVRQLAKEGVAIDTADQAPLSPVMWRHINFLGRYDFSLPDDVAEGRLRQLRKPNSEYDF